MEKERLEPQKLRVALKALIDKSCSQPNIPKRFQKFHIALVKKNFNAIEVSIDYHRKRVYMDIVLDDHESDVATGTLMVPTFRTNLLYQNLNEFLNSCIELDFENSPFYAKLLHSFSIKPEEHISC